MKISYRREMKHNYLIIVPDDLVWKNYECSMLEENAIEGVLRFQIRQMDDEMRFYYEITSRQPLSRLLENQMVRTAELRSLVLGISAVLDRMEQYLLRESSILLDPDYIYVEPETFRVWLCLVPALERDFPEDYGKLLEYLLGKVDHQDKESVVLAYGLYQETRKENYGMEDILRLLRSQEGEKNRREQTGIWEDAAELEYEERSGWGVSEQEEAYRKKAYEAYEAGEKRWENELDDRKLFGKKRRKEKSALYSGRKSEVQESGNPAEKTRLWKRFRRWLSRGKKRSSRIRFGFRWKCCFKMKRSWNRAGWNRREGERTDGNRMIGNPTDGEWTDGKPIAGNRTTGERINEGQRDAEKTGGMWTVTVGQRGGERRTAGAVRNGWRAGGWSGKNIKRRILRRMFLPETIRFYWRICHRIRGKNSVVCGRWSVGRRILFCHTIPLL